jgi:hypothetical protein
VAALLDEIKHVVHDAPVGGTRQSRSGAMPIKGASIRHGKQLNKPMKDSISSNSVGERVGKSPVVELLEDVVGAYALQHLWKLRLRKISLQAHERLHLL